MPLKPPALDPASVTPISSSGYPPEYKARVLPRERRALGDALGLTKIGVNLTTLEPGKESSMRHWHTHEDEFIYVVSGEVVLRTDAGEQTLVAGQCAGFKAGTADGHQFVNRTSTTAVYLAISNRDDADECYYPDVDLAYNAPAARGRFARKDGTPC
jgi:uncharacterized cupin superfamily protein